MTGTKKAWNGNLYQYDREGRPYRARIYQIDHVRKGWGSNLYHYDTGAKKYITRLWQIDTGAAQKLYNLRFLHATPVHRAYAGRFGHVVLLVDVGYERGGVAIGDERSGVAIGYERSGVTMGKGA